MFDISPRNSSTLIAQCQFLLRTSGTFSDVARDHGLLEDAGRMSHWIVPSFPRKSSDFRGCLTNSLGNSSILIARSHFFPGISGAFSVLARGHLADAFVVDAQISWGFGTLGSQSMNFPGFPETFVVDAQMSWEFLRFRVDDCSQATNVSGNSCDIWYAANSQEIGHAIYEPRVHSILKFEFESVQ